MNIAIVHAHDSAQVETHLKPFLEKLERAIIARIIQAYRNPETSLETFHGLAAELSSIETIREEFRVARRVATRAQQKEIADAQASS